MCFRLFMAGGTKCENESGNRGQITHAQQNINTQDAKLRPKTISETAYSDFVLN